MTNVSAKGRTYIHGKAVSTDLRQLVVDDLIGNGAIEGNAIFKGLYSLANQTANKFKLSTKAVVSYWHQ